MLFVQRFQIHTYIHTRTHARTHTRALMHTHTYIHTHIHTHIQTCTYIHTHIHTHTYIIYKHAHTHTYIHTYTHTHLLSVSEDEVKDDTRQSSHNGNEGQNIAGDDQPEIKALPSVVRGSIRGGYIVRPHVLKHI